MDTATDSMPSPSKPSAMEAKSSNAKGRTTEPSGPTRSLISRLQKRGTSGSGRS